MKTVILANATEIPLGEGRNFDVGGKLVAVFHTRAGEVFATDARCPHRQGPLADGLVGPRHVVCPLHERVFDLGSGKSASEDCTLTTYPTKVDVDGLILVELPEDA
jgi:nitrite reductase (NADH) small subunit